MSRVSFVTKTGQHVSFLAGGKKKSRRRRSSRRSLRGLRGRSLRGLRAGWQDMEKVARKAENQKRGCLKANGRLKKGFKYAKGGLCVEARDLYAEHAEAYGIRRSHRGGGRSTGKGKKSKSASYPGNKYAPKSKYPCVRKSGKFKGKIRKGWYIKKGRCIQSAKGAARSSGLMKRGKLPKGHRWKGSQVWKGSDRIMGLRGLGRVGKRRAKKQLRTCQVKSGARRGRLKRGWTIKSGRCTRRRRRK